MLKKQLLSIFEALLYIMLTYWLIDSFFAFNKYDWMLESGDNICSIPSVSGEDRILQAMIAAFFLLTPLIILILKKTLYAGNVRVLAICILARYLSGLWLVAFLGTVLYFAISKVYESRFNGSHRQRSYQLTFASNPPCFAFPKSTFMPCNLAIRWTIDSPSPLPVAVCPGGR